MIPDPDVGEKEFSTNLKKYAQALEQEVADRTRELSDRVAELEDARKAAANLLEDLDAEREKLAISKAKDEAMLVSIGDGLIAVDADAKIIRINSSANRMLGWTDDEMIGKSFFSVVPIEDEQEKPILQKDDPIAISLADGTTITGLIYHYIRKDGTKFPVAITVSRVMLNDKIVGAIEVFRDISKEKELDREKNEFISIASHQMRTPLTGIQWVVERFTKKEKLTPKGKEYLEDIHTSAKQLIGLVDLLLNLSRIEAGRIGTTPEPLEFIGFIKDFLGETVPLRDKKKLKLAFEDHPPELAVITDKSAIRNIVQSLVSNAIEYTQDGGSIAITVKKSASTFLMTVQDTGIGIPRMEQSHIFEKFVRASNAKLYKTDGTGIGLYIAARSTNLLGGKIWFESEENKGSTFHVELPLEFKLKEGEG
ncbi:MAG TPA: ATP-binding protein [Candidatus Paceibacterota bacterium]|nr:ATP-binding protein [Candidatus Paceibacterota bacterium]